MCIVKCAVCCVLTFSDLHKHSQLSGVTTAPAIHTDVPYAVCSVQGEFVVCSTDYTVNFAESAVCIMHCVQILYSLQLS